MLEAFQTMATHVPRLESCFFNIFDCIFFWSVHKRHPTPIAWKKTKHHLIDGPSLQSHNWWSEPRHGWQHGAWINSGPTMKKVLTWHRKVIDIIEISAYINEKWGKISKNWVNGFSILVVMLGCPKLDISMIFLWHTITTFQSFGIIFLINTWNCYFKRS